MIAPMYAEHFRDPPCPLCDSEDVRWRGRRPYDFLFTWLRWLVEAVAQFFSPRPRSNQRGETPERMKAEILEANTGHITPKRFWRCRACQRSGYEFDERRMPGS